MRAHPTWQRSLVQNLYNTRYQMRKLTAVRLHTYQTLPAEGIKHRYETSTADLHVLIISPIRDVVDWDPPSSLQ
jgi:hypothetical protein